MTSNAKQVATTSPFLWGTFNTLSLAEIFGVLSLSRQLVRVCFSDGDKEVGAIAVKAGQVIGAEDFRTRTRGADALTGLLNDPGTAFSVVKLPRNMPGIQNAAAIGKLGELLPLEGRRLGSVVAAPRTEPTSTGLTDSSAHEGALDASELKSPTAIDKGVEVPVELGGVADGDPARSPSPSVHSAHDDKVVLRGNIGEISFEEILDVLQLNQEHLLITFNRGRSEVGTLNLKAEQVLAAAAGSLRGKEAFRELYADHGETFEVRRAEPLDATETLGGVSGLLDDMQRESLASPSIPSSMAQGDRSLFMQGELSEFPLEVLVGSLSLCRQPIELVLRRDEKMLHRVLVKSGRITDAVSTRGKGIEAALAAIREDPGVEFLVYRCKEPHWGPTVSSLRALVSDSEAVSDPAEERAALSPGDFIGAPAASELRESEARADQLLGIESRLEQIAAEVTSLRVSLKIPKQESARAGSAEALSRFVAAEGKRGEERERANGELEILLAKLGPSLRERALLWCIVALQFGFLVVAVGLLLLAMGYPVNSITGFG